MNEFCGILWFDGRTATNLDIQPMLPHIAHSGTNSVCVHCNGPAVFGASGFHSSPDPVQDTLIIKSPDSDLVLCGDISIYNRRELANQLGIAPNLFNKMSDRTLLMTAYEKWDKACLHHLIGDFAWAAWNNKTKSLTCARDHFGMRPLYYFTNRELFAFASRINCLLTLETIPDIINEARLVDFIEQKVNNNSYTFYQHIHRLEPAHLCIISNRNKHIKPYWLLDPLKENPDYEETEYFRQFKNLFTEAVRSRVRTKTGTGSFLSGGLDSSSITCVARDLLLAENRQLHTFSATFTGLPDVERRLTDESEYQRSVTALSNIVPHVIEADRLAPLESLDKLISLTGEPFLGPNVYFNWEIFRRCRESNISLLLDGHDGDTIISHGYEVLQDLMRTFRWHSLCQELTIMAHQRNASFTKILSHYLLRPYFRKPVADLYHALRRKIEPNRYRSLLLHPDFALQVPPAPKPSDTGGHQLRPAILHHFKQLSSPLLPMVNELNYSFSRHWQVESRSPFFDRRLVEFCLALPPTLKRKNGLDRYILRSVMKNIVPEPVRIRIRKSDLRFAFYRGLLRDHREMVSDIISSPLPQLSEKINLKYVRQCWQRLQDSPTRRSSTDAMAVYICVMLARWFNSRS